MLSPHLPRRFGRWVGRTPHPVAARLYVKRECGLCERARAILRPLERQGCIAVEAVDIERDPALFRRYWLEIPVLELEDGTRLAWPFDDAALRRALR